MKHTVEEINALLKEFQKLCKDYESHIGKSIKSLDQDGVNIIRKRIPELLYVLFDKELYNIKGSVGQGCVAYCPWVVVRHKAASPNTREGVYIVFLFSRDLKEIYLTLNQGVTDVDKNVLLSNQSSIRSTLNKESALLKHDNDFNVDNNGYKIAAIYTSKWEPNDNRLCTDILESYIDVYGSYISHFFAGTAVGTTVGSSVGASAGTPIGITPVTVPVAPSSNDFSIKKMIEYIAATGLQYDPNLIKRFAFALMTKPFVILSGLAGSGKTQLALVFAKALAELHDKDNGSDGGVDKGTETDKGIDNDNVVDPDRVIETDIESDKETSKGNGNEKVQDQICTVAVGADWTNREPMLGYPNALDSSKYVSPESGVLDLLIRASMPENQHKPYFLILDEMNMSYVERYFADFLSGMESREAIRLWNTGVEGGIPNEIKLPKNLYIIGTINVDETTYMFSPKVLDRANVIEFKISVDEMTDFLGNISDVDSDGICGKASNMAADFVDRSHKAAVLLDDDVKKTLVSFFTELKSVNAEFGYRSANEIYKYIDVARVNDDTDKKMDDDMVLDSAIVQKLLPKLHGSRKKLTPVLRALWKLCCPDSDLETNELGVPGNAKYPLSADKILRMYRCAVDNGFASFSEA